MSHQSFTPPLQPLSDSVIHQPAAAVGNGINTGVWQPFSAAKEDLHPTGIDVIGAVPWGSHFCQFYATSQDLVEILVPYFAEGLAANEYCMWITSIPLQVEEAKAALSAALPELDDYFAKDQIEILDYSQWYIQNGQFDASTVLQRWTDKLENAIARGFTGLRLTGNTFWLEGALWEDFTRYEEIINQVIGSQRMIALCTYSLEKCGAREIMDVVANHQFALIKSRGRWEIIESSTHKKMEQALRESEARYRNLFEGMTEGFGLHEIICDEVGSPVDYRFIDINPAFEQLTGLKRADVVGKTLSQVLPGDDPKWVQLYGKVALTGEPVHFENYSPGLDRYYRVFAYRPAPRQFAVIFMNITEQKRAEQALLRNLAQIEVHHRLLEQREQERLQIARDLHDGPIQSLTAAALQVQYLMGDASHPEMVASYQELKSTLQDTMSELRGYAQELRPPTLTRFGLLDTICSHANIFQEKHPGLVIRVQDRGGSDTIPPEMHLALFRIFQESLNNIVRHAQATQVEVHLWKESNEVHLEIQDNGVGFETSFDWLELARKGHLGLVGMRERAEALGGEMTLHSVPGAGTTVAVRLPVIDQP